MDERLKNLKHAMKKNTFADVHFTEEQRMKVRDQMQPDIERELFTLLTEHRTATELIQLLHVKGVKSIWQNEGLVFIKLHQAEAAGDVEGLWDKQGTKSYRLTKQGLHKYAEDVQPKWSFKRLLHEVKPNES
ncbi:hypothetical protein P9B03_03105 [Metasolibacillus meyeri]|uniref:Uncharacterized protein n=1 Tax=Metasolibacillus meyeri TaxID=1071052 RepID=A0AAW9NSQ6_9BACL|nr:hypothetical protein [Metasolibacillus meyeri]MEC1177460.1 hypothetical protein [Metasolibacillus meyeri]